MVVLQIHGCTQLDRGIHRNRNGVPLVCLFGAGTGERAMYRAKRHQYNRLKLRAGEHPGLPYDLSWRLFDEHENDRPSGFGSLHLGTATVESLRELSAVTYGARRINNRFGEGTSPRLRQIREGLEALGSESSHVLYHATPRLFCATELEPFAREQLLGLCVSDNPQPARLNTIAAAWRRSWTA
jgi:hypothetical protein